MDLNLFALLILQSPANRKTYSSCELEIHAYSLETLQTVEIREERAMSLYWSLFSVLIVLVL